MSEAKDSSDGWQHVQTLLSLLLLLLLLLLLDFLLLTSQIVFASVDGVTVEEVQTFSPFALSETIETSAWLSPCFTKNPAAAIKS
jgi:hypothetical protein